MLPLHKKKSMTVSDNTKTAERLGDFFNLGQTPLRIASYLGEKANKRMSAKALKNPWIAFEISANAFENPWVASSHVIKVYRTGKDYTSASSYRRQQIFF